MTALTDLTLAEARDQLRAKQISAVELADAHIRAVERIRPLNAFITETLDLARERAKLADKRLAEGKAGALEGIPLAIKDLFCTEGVLTTAASHILKGFHPPYESTVTANLKRAGAVMLGKTNLDEFAMGSSNMTSHYGPVESPWRRQGDNRPLVPGGSSGGSAAAVAARACLAATGTDTGGSIRQPAAFCGIVGLKPTYGAVSRYGMIAFASSLDQCGPLTRTVSDAALLLAMLQGRDPLDSTSVGIEGGVSLPDREDLSGLRFGVPAELARDAVDAGVREVFERTLERIEALGGEIAEVSLPNAEHGISAYYVIAPAEASSNLARYDGVRYGMRAGGDGDLIEMYETTRSEGFGAEVKRRIMLGTYALSSGYYEAYYGQAQKVRTRIAEDFTGAFADVDFVVTPTAPSVAFKLGEKTDDPLSMYLNDFFTVPMSLAGIPAISIPAGLAEPEGDGPQLPVGFQIAAPAFAEQKLLDAAYALEQGIAFEVEHRSRAPWLQGVGGG
jgi:aspartyl-tRNA(Asn)/glutamyl-tRNA(Gln) amidotransferase subunit A